MISTDTLRTQRKRFPGISPRAWEHPADRAALAALRKVPGLDTLLQTLVGITTERSLRLMYLASAVRVSERQFAPVNLIYREACAILDVQEVPELYISQSPVFNARAVGVERPFIVLNSSLVDSLDSDELLAVLAHELAHCMSGHVLYKTVLQVLTQLSIFALQIPLGGASILAIIMALREWDRKSELSADRAEILVTQDPNVSYTLLMKLAGGRQIDQMDINEFFVQAAEYESSGTVVDSIHKLINLAGQSHPFAVLRLTELKAWVDAGAYKKILDGEYPRRDDQAKNSVYNDIRDAANQYREDFRNSKDPLTGAVRNASENFDAARDKAKEFFDTLFGQRK